mmetsp:Transcript_36851/g.80632  ORF Transcript_36851/g.80632 Transcript_36851/m.80632 type:complete len:220 (+) Transcript_36851:1107-1766(+)
MAHHPQDPTAHRHHLLQVPTAHLQDITHHIRLVHPIIQEDLRCLRSMRPLPIRLGRSRRCRVVMLRRLVRRQGGGLAEEDRLNSSQNILHRRDRRVRKRRRRPTSLARPNRSKSSTIRPRLPSKMMTVPTEDVGMTVWMTTGLQRSTLRFPSLARLKRLLLRLLIHRPRLAKARVLPHRTCSIGLLVLLRPLSLGGGMAELILRTGSPVDNTNSPLRAP